MPKGTVPSHLHDILQSKALGHLATIDANGHPSVNPIWFIWDGTNVLFSVKADTLKYRNMRANPRIAISISDPAEPHRYVEIRGSVVNLELFETLIWVNQLSQKYAGRDFPPEANGEPRYKVTLAVESWTGQS